MKLKFYIKKKLRPIVKEYEDVKEAELFIETIKDASLIDFGKLIVSASELRFIKKEF